MEPMQNQIPSPMMPLLLTPTGMEDSINQRILCALLHHQVRPPVLVFMVDVGHHLGASKENL